MLQDESFSSWVKNISRGIKVTAEVYLRRVGRICSLLGTTQCDLGGMSKKEAGEVLIRAVSSLEKEGNRGSTIAGYVKSFYVGNQSRSGEENCNQPDLGAD